MEQHKDVEGNEQQEEFVVVQSDAVIYPSTVVVKPVKRTVTEQGVATFKRTEESIFSAQHSQFPSLS